MALYFPNIGYTKSFSEGSYAVHGDGIYKRTVHRESVEYHPRFFHVPEIFSGTFSVTIRIYTA